VLSPTCVRRLLLLLAVVFTLAHPKLLAGPSTIVELRIDLDILDLESAAHDEATGPPFLFTLHADTPVLIERSSNVEYFEAPEPYEA
jgi:hypothetical protein